MHGPGFGINHRTDNLSPGKQIEDESQRYLLLFHKEGKPATGIIRENQIRMITLSLRRFQHSSQQKPEAELMKLIEIVYPAGGEG